MSDILTYALIGLAALALLMLVVQLFKIKVWILAKDKRSQRLSRIGFLTVANANEVPEVHLLDKAKGVAIGRVKMGENNDDNAYIEVLLSNPEDETAKPKYRTYGFISQDGYIYKTTDNGSKPEKIGYTARPSDPNTPIAIGERNWKTLWLRCTLNAYMGLPDESSSPSQSDSSHEEEENQDSKKEEKKEGKKKKRKARGRMPAAVATYTGIHSSTYDAMPPEARSAAYGVFYNLYNKNDYREHYNSPAFGWKDTALPAAFIYAVIYCVWYMVQVKILGLRFIGYKFWLDIPLYLGYYAVWVIVRGIKIECIERSDTLQPRIDLFNKTLGQRGYDLLILACCATTMLFFPYYRFDFMPLALAVASAVGINMGLKTNSLPWKVINPYTIEEEEIEEEILENPTGDIERQYQWSLESDKSKEGRLELYFNAQYIRDLRYVNPFFNQRNDKSIPILIKEMFGYVVSHSGVSARSRYVIKRIREIANKHGFEDKETLQFLLDFVQEPNIRYVPNSESDAILKFEDYIRYPDEVLYDKEGDSNSKAFLGAVLIHYLGYNAVFLFSRMQKYGAIGVELNPEWVSADGNLFGRKKEEITFDYAGKTYIFCETSVDGFHIGGSLGGMKPSDFDIKVEIPLLPAEGDDSNSIRKTCLYNWDLDPRRGHQLHGTYTLEFEAEEMITLRDRNPFVNYGIDGQSYEDNVATIFSYLDREPERKRKVRELAAYIKQQVNEAGLDEAEMLQFALDFCQEPNIVYKIDEVSSGINYNEHSKEYMRFPDEVLYDKEGDCDCKSSLTIALFKELGYRSLFMISQEYGHAAVGVEYKPVLKAALGITGDNVVREYNGVEYLYCETTGDGFRLGDIQEGNTIQNFEKVVEIS